MDSAQILKEIYDKFVKDYKKSCTFVIDIDLNEEDQTITLDLTDYEGYGYLITLKATMGKPYYFYMGDLVFWDLKLLKRYKNKSSRSRSRYNGVYTRTVTHSRLLDPENAGESLENVLDWIREEQSKWLDSFMQLSQYTESSDIASLDLKVKKFVHEENKELQNIIYSFHTNFPSRESEEVESLDKLFPSNTVLTTFPYNYYIVEYSEEGSKSMKLARVVTLSLPEGSWLDPGVSKKASIIVPSEKTENVIYSIVTLRQDDSYGYPIRIGITESKDYTTIKEVIREEYVQGLTELAEKINSLDYLDNMIEEIS
jgi:hypothetical protein